MTCRRSVAEREQHKRQALLAEGSALCYSQGLHALRLRDVGANARISKRTIYVYYGTRMHFIAAVLDYDAAIWREWFFDAVRERADRPRDRLYAFADVFDRWTQSPDYQGCLFARALYIYESPPEVIVAVVDRHIGAIRDFLRDNARKAGATRAKALAENLMLPALAVMSGSGNRRDPASGRRFKEIAHALFHRHGIGRG